MIKEINFPDGLQYKKISMESSLQSYRDIKYPDLDKSKVSNENKFNLDDEELFLGTKIFSRQNFFNNFLMFF